MFHQRVTLPTGAPLDVYAAPSPVDPAKIHRAMVICPGGGYNHLSPREAEPVALRFAAMGFSTFVLHYRVAGNHFPDQLQDVGCAVAHIRQHAQAYYVNPDAIAVLGFSAGAHVAGSLGVMWHEAAHFHPLGLTCQQVKPNALVLCYPVISADTFAHRGSFQCLTGSDDPVVHRRYSLEKLVSSDTPPTFLWHTWEDQSVPVENTLCFASALYRHGVQAEVHVYPHGPHGGALCNEITASTPSKLITEAAEWPDLAARFLRDVM